METKLACVMNLMTHAGASGEDGPENAINRYRLPHRWYHNHRNV
jgi:hypothetical protein